MIRLALVLILLSASPALATTDGYCRLWSRDVAEIEVRAGEQLELQFIGPDLAYLQKPDPDIATADANMVELRVNSHFRTCLALIEYDTLPLPDVPAAQTKAWAARVATFAVGRQGIAPASPKLNGDPSRPDLEAWQAACAAEYLTWDETDGTVIRRGSPDRVRCPLVLRDGAWIIDATREDKP